MEKFIVQNILKAKDYLPFTKIGSSTPFNSLFLKKFHSDSFIYQFLRALGLYNQHPSLTLLNHMYRIQSCSIRTFSGDRRGSSRFLTPSIMARLYLKAFWGVVVIT